MTDDLKSWSPRQRPDGLSATGRTVRIERIVDDRRFGELYDAFSADAEGTLYAWLPYGPFESRSNFMDFARRTYIGGEPCFYAIIPQASDRAEGVAALMRTDTVMGVTEVGHVCLAPSLQRTVAATEAFALLMAYVFDALGYRRFEWKCDNGNAPSKNAAARLGFVEEGLFRQHMIVKGRNRDTSWWSIVDTEWPALRHAFSRWLDPANFDGSGRQIRPLSEFRG
ncbi:acetyltransferase GCN5 [Aureimonas sp. SA4125]|uniref:GNAT family N-acetyltransferase n=1 Tax=Aureimonas sp. SA4125 TaxID=2826993 RepID=UPI001CC6081E|nr:GNAT family protein [Aureimonas sp. SA4125]BDA86065.1 acetyltransferase GCN5 [Aureimonas sp. SA4125]